MPDIMTELERSKRMSLIRAKDTKPEMRVRRLIHAMGYRYRLHSRKLPGKPDMVFASRRKVIFVHGCFWHMHKGCRINKPPKSRLEYWIPKLEGNKARDAANRRKLNKMGWSSLVIWECETEAKDLKGIARKARKFLGPSSREAQRD